MELKFRAWDKRYKAMEKIHDLYWFEENGVRDDDGEGYNTSYDIMIYSGMKDSTRTEEFPLGKEVYENDILKDLKGNTYRVIFFNGMFLADANNEIIGRKHLVEVLSSGAFVIGNWYENGVK